MSDQPVHPQDSIRHALLSTIPRHAYPEIPTPASVLLGVAPHPEELDRRLEGYQLVFLLAGPPPDDQNRLPRPVIPMHGHMDDGWVLWHAWLKWPEAAVIGELRHDPVYGWIASHISRPGDSQDDIDRIVHALAILQRRVPPLGRPKGARLPGIGPYTSLEGFLEAARRERDRLRRNRDPVEKEVLAPRLAVSVRTLERGLRACGFTWEVFRDEP